MSTKGFRIVICSDLDYEGMVVDVNYDNQRVATLNCDKGKNNIEVDLVPEYEEKLRVPYAELLRAFEAAKVELLNAN